LDWLMPELNGPAVCREIRRHSEFPHWRCGCGPAVS
jgi:CheY-like chemotaxis protein